MQVKLFSDFVDYYDHWFDLEGEEYHRMSRTTMTRREMFERLNYLGLQTPEHGNVRLLNHWVLPEQLVVVYVADYAHRSEGKEVMPMGAAIEKYPECYASRFIPKHEKDYFYQRTTSYRYLRIGNSQHHLVYISNDIWRSNYGDVTIKKSYCPIWLNGVIANEKEHYPLFAIDFIEAKHGVWLAVDYNTAPGLKGTPIEDDLNGKEVVNLIKDWYSFRKENQC